MQDGERRPGVVRSVAMVVGSALLAAAAAAVLWQDAAVAWSAVPALPIAGVVLGVLRGLGSALRGTLLVAVMAVAIALAALSGRVEGPITTILSTGAVVTVTAAVALLLARSSGVKRLTARVGQIGRLVVALALGLLVVVTAPVATGERCVVTGERTSCEIVADPIRENAVVAVLAATGAWLVLVSARTAVDDAAEIRRSVDATPGDER